MTHSCKTLITAAALSCVAAASTTTMAASDLMTPETLWSMHRVGGQTASPDGKRVAYTVSTPDIAANKIRTSICLINADGSGRTVLTPQGSSESQPAFIHKGNRIAFLSAGNLWTMDTAGADRRQLYDGGDLEGFLFSPDETMVILIRQVEATSSIQPQEKDLPLATGLVIDDMNYKHWDQYVRTIPHIFLASVDGDAVSIQKDILEGEPYECPVKPFGGAEQLAWSPDSKSIAYTSREKTGIEYALSTDTDIYLYNTETGTTTNLCKPADYKAPAIDATKTMKYQAVNAPENLKNNPGYDQNPKFSPDGKYVALWLLP